MARRDKKGFFSDVALPVARKYVDPASRRPMVLLGGLLIAFAAAFLAADYLFRDAAFVSNGPLSSAHATLEDDCAACHDAFESATGEKCSVCHEKHGDRLGVYNWDAHYIYRSSDFGRVERKEHESSCAACHLEHRGREERITRVADARCDTCHPFGSFNDEHPQFDFAAESRADEAGLTFPHAQHVRELMKREELVDAERACLYCHVARSDGKSFEPISFDGHCDACHLTAAKRTPPLPLAAESDPGVVTLAEIRARRAPGTEWALFMGAGEFRERGGEVTKSPIYHPDPWIMENLRLLRRRLYDDPGLADLLAASADVPPAELPALYEEALATLESYALGLRARPEPEIQQDLRRIGQVLDGLRRALRDPLTPFDETKFLLALGGRRGDLAAGEAEAVEALIGELAAPCLQCHAVEDATFVRVQEDQRVLRRAEFDHRAHILQVRCLECHHRIPIEENLDLARKLVVDPEADHAAIQNLPAIETCRECHEPALTSNSCVTCHFFHPNKSRRSEMLLYLDAGRGAE